MDERRIAGIRRKIILASTLSYFLVMLFMGGIIYVFTSVTERNEVGQVISYIAENDGDMPALDEGERESGQEDGDDPEGISWSFDHFLGLGNIFGGRDDYASRTRYFAVLYDTDGQMMEVKSRYMPGLDEERAQRLAQRAIDRLLDLGSIGTYYYGVMERQAGGTIVVFLDRTSQIFIVRRILYMTLILLGMGSLIAFCLMRALSHRLVQPEIENARRQQQFVTNASHELKTPVAVIRANTEMQEMLVGETEWTASTMRQVARLEGLIANLVMIARSRERDGSSELQLIDLSAPVLETAQTFAPVAGSDGKRLETDVQEGLHIFGQEADVRQLVSLLTDNAVKYCDPDGLIRVSLEKKGRQARLTVSNAYAAGEGMDTSRFFERFYREDSSHNEKGGYGIGLSVAQSLSQDLGGKLDVSWKDGVISFTFQVPVHKG